MLISLGPLMGFDWAVFFFFFCGVTYIPKSRKGPWCYNALWMSTQTDVLINLTTDSYVLGF